MLPLKSGFLTVNVKSMTDLGEYFDPGDRLDIFAVAIFDIRFYISEYFKFSSFTVKSPKKKNEPILLLLEKDSEHVKSKLLIFSFFKDLYPK